MFKPFTIWSEKLSGCGEDAEPVVIVSEDRAFGMAAVFDGLGGSGAGRFELPGGATSTGARLAAQLARKTLIDTVSQIWLHPVGEDDYRSRWNLAERAATSQIEPARELSSLSTTGRHGSASATVSMANLKNQKPLPIADTYGACFTFANVPNPPLSAFDGATIGRSFDLLFANAISHLMGQASSSRVKSRAKRHLPTTIAGVFFHSIRGRCRSK